MTYPRKQTVSPLFSTSPLSLKDICSDIAQYTAVDRFLTISGIDLTSYLVIDEVSDIFTVTSKSFFFARKIRILLCLYYETSFGH